MRVKNIRKSTLTICLTVLSAVVASSCAKESQGSSSESATDSTPAFSATPTEAPTTEPPMPVDRGIRVTTPDGWVYLLSLGPTMTVTFGESIEYSPPGKSRFQISIGRSSRPTAIADQDATPGRIAPTIDVYPELVVGGEDWELGGEQFKGNASLGYGTRCSNLFGDFDCGIGLSEPDGPMTFVYRTEVDSPSSVVNSWIAKARAAKLLWRYALSTTSGLAICSVYRDVDGNLTQEPADSPKPFKKKPFWAKQCPSISEN